MNPLEDLLGVKPGDFVRACLNGNDGLWPACLSTRVLLVKVVTGPRSLVAVNLETGRNFNLDSWILVMRAKS